MEAECGEVFLPSEEQGTAGYFKVYANDIFGIVVFSRDSMFLDFTRIAHASTPHPNHVGADTTREPAAAGAIAPDGQVQSEIQCSSPRTSHDLLSTTAASPTTFKIMAYHSHTALEFDMLWPRSIRHSLGFHYAS